MLMVVVLHVLGQGGVLDNTQSMSANYMSAWFLEIACLCAVNCFAIISGYVLFSSHFKLSRLVSLWMQTVFYTILISAVFFILNPQSISLKGICEAIFPISSQCFWYISAYFGLYILLPLLNIAAQKLDKKAYTGILVICFFAMSVMPSVLACDPYRLDNGYGLMWLCIMYLVGAYIRRFEVFSKVHRLSAFFTYLLAVMVTWGFKIIFQISDSGQTAQSYSLMLSAYTQPFMVIAAVALFALFMGAKLHRGVKKAVAIISPAALGVYIIHTFRPVWENFVFSVARPSALKSAPMMLLDVISITLSIYLVCTIAELLRIKLFKALGADRLSGKIAVRLQSIIDRFIKE